MMRKILLINPNSSEKMTADIKNTVVQMQLPDIEITTVKGHQKCWRVLGLY
jgi:Asp/Glu/hydantoin racemase